MRKLLLLVPILALAPLFFAGDQALTSITPASTTATSPAPVTDLPVLRNQDFGSLPVPTPATPATPSSAVAQPAAPATPALPPGATVGTPSPTGDPCDGFDNVDARERCREDQQQFNEQDFERTHNTPTPFPTQSP